MFDKLRELLLALEPVGVGGFEGLMADALSSLTGLSIHISKSGSQYGRDGSSAPGPFAIAMEAKRYKEEPRLEVLAGKAVVGGHTLSDHIDLWVLAVTSPVGDQTQFTLDDILEKRGVSLLILDWTARPIPMLAVVFAAAPQATLIWFGRYQASSDRDYVEQELQAVREHPSYCEELQKLKRKLSPAAIGLDVLRRRNGEWLAKRFEDASASRRSFGQRIAVMDQQHPPAVRLSLLRAVSGLIRPYPDSATVVALIGDEGSGKTWIVAQWWAELLSRPIMLFVAGRRVDELKPGKPEESIARLLASEQGGLGDGAIASWQRRLDRWKQRGAEKHLRFVVVLDGINERASLPWADLIVELAQEVRSIGGVLIVTCRPGFWRRDVRPRLDASVSVETQEVGNFTDAELDMALSLAGLSSEKVPPGVWDFMRSPRVCRVAIHCVDALALQPCDLTVDRLLLEYWRARLSERGDSVAHTTTDFQTLLRSHATEWLKSSNPWFGRDDWAQHSGAVRRDGLRAVRHDLTEIEEGRFLRVDSQDLSRYEFRSEALPFALALLVVADSRDAVQKGHEAEHALNVLLDPIRDFDRVAEILAASLTLACLDEQCPEAARSAILQALLGVQNISDDAEARMTAIVPTCPDLFLNALEGATQGHTRRDLLFDILKSRRDTPTVQSAIGRRLPKWLGRWSRQSGNGQGAIDLDARIRQLSGPEKDLFLLHTSEAQEHEAPQLDIMAAALLQGGPLAGHVRSFFGWALARATTLPSNHSWEAVAWLFRLNAVDWHETRQQMNIVTTDIGSHSSEPIRRAAASLLRLPGDQEAAAAADRLHPFLTSESKWRSANRYCDTNPHDPTTAAGAGLKHARAVALEFPVETAWQGAFQTAEDHTLNEVTPALARFEPHAAVELLRRLARSVSTRGGSSLYGFTLRAASLAPLLTSPEVKALRAAYEELCASDAVLAEGLRQQAATTLLCTLMPHFPGREQLLLMLLLPHDEVLQTRIFEAARPLETDDFEQRLQAAITADDASTLARTLIFSGYSRQPLSPVAKESVIACLRHRDSTVVQAAAFVALQLADRHLLKNALDLFVTTGEAVGGFFAQSLLAEAIVQLRRLDLLAYLPSRHVGLAAADLQGKAVEVLADYWDRIVTRFVLPNSLHGLDARTLDADVGNRRPSAAVTSEGCECNWESHRREGQPTGEPTALQRASAPPLEIQRPHSQGFEAHQRQIQMDESRALFEPPQLLGLRELVDAQPLKVSGWLDAILRINDLERLTRLRNHGIALAYAYSKLDPGKSLQVFEHLKGAPTTIRVLVGTQRVPLYEYAVFHSSDAPELDELRRDILESAIHDSDLEAATLAAEASGGAAWLNTYIEAGIVDPHPAVLARALTVAGFRMPNAVSAAVLQQDWGTGFLGQVAQAARKNYERALWAGHWLDSARGARSAVDFWRFVTLAEGVVDARYSLHWDRPPVGWARDTVHNWAGRFARAAEQRKQKRKSLLFGMARPSS